MSRILIVEDEKIIRTALRKLLEKKRFQVDDAGSVDEATSRFNLSDFNLIISDLRLPGAPGTDLISLAKSVPVLIMTSYASLRSAVDAMKLGAVDYIAKPFDHNEMLSTVQKVLANQAQAATTTQPAGTSSPTQMLGSCPAMQELFKRINKVASTDATVLIQGESGTGKELAARSIHEQSNRADTPMISVNCASIPENLIESELFGHEKGAFPGATSSQSGLLEAADGGTLFLDEIGELPLEAQARLLRFLQEGEIRRSGSVQAKKVDVRLIASTHRDLKNLSQQGEFRQDLFYRLYVVELYIPPLRERNDDIFEMAEGLLSEICQRMQLPQLTFCPNALKVMQQHAWPGNVRELKNTIERAVILAEGDLITEELLGLDLSAENSTEKAEQSQTDNGVLVEKRDLSLDNYFQRFVLEHQNQLSETELAKKLGISRKCLWERRQKLGIPRKAKKQ